MYVMVGRKKINVVVEQDVRDDARHQTDEVFRPGNLQIALDIGTPREKRRELIVHALVHAYEFVFGRIAVDDAEGRANRTAAMDDQLNVDLVRQNGENVIHALFGDEDDGLADNAPGEPIRIPYGTDDGAADWPTDVACPLCGVVYSAHAIKNGDPYLELKSDGYAMTRALACTACDRDTVWTQRCSYDAVPWPKVVAGPSSIRKQINRAG